MFWGRVLCGPVREIDAGAWRSSGWFACCAPGVVGYALARVGHGLQVCWQRLHGHGGRGRVVRAGLAGPDAGIAEELREERGIGGPADGDWATVRLTLLETGGRAAG